MTTAYAFVHYYYTHIHTLVLERRSTGADAACGSAGKIGYAPFDEMFDLDYCCDSRATIFQCIDHWKEGIAFEMDSVRCGNVHFM